MFEYKSPRGRDGSQKAITFGSFAHQFGWSGKWTKDEETQVTHLFCRRGENETIDIWWINGCVMPGHEPVYTLAGERIKMRNLSAVSKVVTTKPDADRLKKATRKRKRQSGLDYTSDSVDELITSMQGSLPFDHESDDDEIEAVLHKRTVTWINRLSGETDSAFVNADKQFNITRNGRDYVTFCDAAHGGFRSVYLDSIISVG